MERVPRFTLGMDMQDKVDHDMRLELEVEEIPLTLNHDARAEEAEALGVAADLMQQVDTDWGGDLALIIVEFGYNYVVVFSYYCCTGGTSNQPR